MTDASGPRVAVVDGARTPFAKAGTALRRHRPLALSAHAVRGLVEMGDVDPAIVDDLYWGIVIVDPRVPHMAREVVFESRLPDTVRALTLTDNCITSASGVALAYDAITGGRAEVAIAGGVESMSNPPVLWSERASRAILEASFAKSLPDKVKAILGIRPADLAPSVADFEEPSTGLTMGEHCEIMVKEWEIPREEQDRIAYRSHVNASAATRDGRLPGQIHPLDGIERDLLIREETSMEKLARLPPVFDRSEAGTITAGNSSPLTDGAACVLLMSEDRARREGREPLAFVTDFEFAGIDPDDGLLMGPGVAVPRLLARNGIGLGDVDLVEMHEAFGGQVACNLAAWERGWKEPAIGTVPPDLLNVLGSSIAVGHPFAATGARIVLTLAQEMARRDVRRGLISICGAGATASAMLLER